MRHHQSFFELGQRAPRCFASFLEHAVERRDKHPVAKDARDGAIIRRKTKGGDDGDKARQIVQHGGAGR